MDLLSSICEECMKSNSVFNCVECEQSLCSPCDFLIHRGGNRKGHKRLGLCHSCRFHATQHCSTCNQNLCRSCAFLHNHHIISSILTQNYIVIFWDLNSHKITTGDEISQALSSLKNFYSRIDIFKVYGDSFFKWKHLFISTQAEYSHPEGIRESEAILIDISLLCKDKVSEILLISSKATSYKAHLNQIQIGLPKVKIFVSISFPSISPIPISDLSSEHQSTLVPSKIGLAKPSSIDLKSQEKPISDHFPVYQTFSRKKNQNLSHDHLLTYLKELSDSGLIMHDSSWICKAFAQRSRISILQSTNIIKELESLGHAHSTERIFCDLKTMYFTSLKIEGLSFESLLWALRSLKLDEMLPTERAIQSRIKEAFDFKVSTAEWTYLLDVIKNMHHHTHTKSAPEQINYSLFSSQSSLFSSTSSPVFFLKEALDPVTHSKILVIYPKGEEWDSIDQFIKEGDVLGVKRTGEWEAFVSFLEEYFDVTDPESRAIPGGRYGCAQFLKFCGNQVLKNCSLGKLSYMVQLSIDEDLLRYQKTLLIWTPISPKPVVNNQNSERLLIIQNKIIEVLKENREGMSLAQLPLYLKRKLTFPLVVTELGFAKLKDLLLTLPEIEIEQRGNNHPFAVYRVKRKIKENDIKKLIESEIKPNPTHTGKLDQVLYKKLGSINWAEYKTTSLEDFISKKTSFFLTKDNKVSLPNPNQVFSPTPDFQNLPNPIHPTHKYTYFDPFSSNPPGFNK